MDPERLAEGVQTALTPNHFPTLKRFLMGIFRFGWKYWKKYLPLDILVNVFSLVAILCDLLLPLLSAGIIDYVIAYDPS